MISKALIVLSIIMLYSCSGDIVPPTLDDKGDTLTSSINKFGNECIQTATDLNTTQQKLIECLKESVDLKTQYIEKVKELDESLDLAGMCMCKDLCRNIHGMFEHKSCPEGCQEYLDKLDKKQGAK